MKRVKTFPQSQYILLRTRGLFPILFWLFYWRINFCRKNYLSINKIIHILCSGKQTIFALYFLLESFPWKKPDFDALSLFTLHAKKTYVYTRMPRTSGKNQRSVFSLLWRCLRVEKTVFFPTLKTYRSCMVIVKHKMVFIFSKFASILHNGKIIG